MYKIDPDIVQNMVDNLSSGVLKYDVFAKKTPYSIMKADGKIAKSLAEVQNPLVLPKWLWFQWKNTQRKQMELAKPRNALERAMAKH